MPNKDKIYDNEESAVKAAELWSKSGYTAPNEKKSFKYYDEDGNIKNTDTYTSIKRGEREYNTGGSINKKYQVGGVNRRRMGNNPMVPPTPQGFTPLQSSKSNTPLVTYQQGGKYVGEDLVEKSPTREEMVRRTAQSYQQGGKDVGEGNRVPYAQLDKKKAFYQDGGIEEGEKMMMKEKGELTPTGFDPGVDRQTTEEAGTPTKNLITVRPDGDKWLGDKAPPMYGASEEHIPFLTTVYEMMDAGQNMDQMYHSQEYLRPYIKYIIAGQNDVVLPSLENAEGSKKEDSGKGKLPGFLQNLSKDEILDFIKTGLGHKGFGGVRTIEEKE